MPDLTHLFEVHHLILIIAVLILALLSIGGGKGLGALVKPVIGRLFGKKDAAVIVNIDGGDMSGAPKKDSCSTCGLMVNPQNCPLHEAEHERSMRNQAEIKDQWRVIEELGKQINAGMDRLRKEQAEGIATLHSNQLKLLMGLVQSGVLDPKFVPEGVGIVKPKDTT